MLAAAPAALFPIRVVAAIALAGVVLLFVHVLRHVKKIGREFVAEDLIPAMRGPCNNLIFVASALTFVVASLLVF